MSVLEPPTHNDWKSFTLNDPEGVKEYPAIYLDCRDQFCHKPYFFILSIRLLGMYTPKFFSFFFLTVLILVPCFLGSPANRMTMKTESSAATVETSPSSRGGHVMVYDSGNQKIILFGGFRNPWGYNVSDETWEYDYASNRWTNLDPTTKPSPRAHQCIVYDSVNQKTVLFGGYGPGGDLSDTWTYDYASNKWTQVFPVSSPSIRKSHSMIYDSVNQKIILFGGYGAADRLLNDTWAYDYTSNTWTELNPPTSPIARYGHTMVYDSSNQKVILFGGNTRNAGYQNDTWAYDYTTNTWSELSPTTKPDVRYWHAMVYDSDNQKVILFGGYIQSSNGLIFYNDTWIYDYAIDEWNQASPTIHPPAREGLALAYDSVNQKVILFGGHNNIETLGDTWAYDTASNTWEMMEVLITSADFFTLEILLVSLGVLGIIYWYKRRTYR
ncbi:MAG: Kelch repeat-containing protein [Candidatus Hermodarchaeota archaeon]